MLIKKRLTEMVIDPSEFPFKKGFKVAGKIFDDEKCGKILAIDMYEKETLLSRTFIDRENRNYITLALEGDEYNWCTRDPFAFGSEFYYSTRCNYNYNDKTDAAINEYLNLKDYNSPGYWLPDYLSNIRYDRKNIYRENKWKRTCRHYDLIGNIPKAVTKAIDDLLPGNGIITGKTKTARSKILCMNCRARFTAENVRHKQTIVCPKCGKWILLASTRFATCDSVSHKQRVVYCQKSEEGPLIIEGNVKRSIEHTRGWRYYYKIKLNYFEVSSDNKTYKYKYLPMNMSWCDSRYRPNGNMLVVKDNMEEVKELQPLTEILNLIDGKEANFFGIIDSALPDVALKLLKHGLYKLASETLYFNQYHGDTFERAFGISNEYKQSFRKWDPSYREIQIMKLADCWVNDEMFEKIRFISDSYEHFYSDNMEGFNQMMNYMSFTKMINYLARQIKETKKESGLLIDYYLDYRLVKDNPPKSGQERKKYILPGNIENAHNKVMAEAKISKNRHLERLLNAVYERYHKKFEKSYGKYLIIMPRSIRDFAKEGTTLNHCVYSNGHYTEYHSRRKELTMFIRKSEEPDKPYFTFTLNDDWSYRECYGKEHAVPTKEIRSLIKRFINETIKDGYNIPKIKDKNAA